jgi:RHS repeat-associated protein
LSPKSSRPARLAATLLLLLLGSAVAVAMASGDDASETTTPSSAEDAARVEKLPNRTTATSNTYLLEDGSLETQLFQVPVNYQDQGGDWRPIDEELTELPSGALTNGANSFDIHLPEDLNESPIRVSLGEEWVSEMPVGLQTSPAVLGQDGVASYTAAGGSTDFEFNGLANGLKEVISLADPTAPSTYQFKLAASPGVNPALGEDGSIVFRNGEEEVVAEMPAPFMIDSSGEMAPGDSVRYRLEDAEEGSRILNVEADPQWLQSDTRSWPVVIDPTVTVPTPVRDCIIATTTESQMCGYAGYTNLTAKANYPSSGPDQLARSLLRFSTTSIPKAASLTSATLGLYSAKTATNVTKVDVYDVSRSWNESATWTNAMTTPWTNPGGDFGKYMPTPTSLTPAQRGGSGPGPWNFSSLQLLNLVEGWRTEAGIANNGVLVKLADETPHVCCFERRVEWESSAMTNKPFLSVQYILPAIHDSEVTSPQNGTKTAKRFLLTSAWDHSNVEGVTFQYKNGFRWEDIPTSQVIDGDNKNVSWPLGVSIEDRKSPPLYWNASSLAGADGTAKIKIRAVLTGAPGASGYTKPVDAELDQNSGGPKDEVAAIGPGSVDLLTGNFSVSRSDVSIPGFASSLQFSRSISSREPEPAETGLMGPGWVAGALVREAGGAEWRSLKIESSTETEEVEVDFEVFETKTIVHRWAVLSDVSGREISFAEDTATGKFITPDELAGNILYRNPATSNIEFTDPGGNKTKFANFGSGNQYWPTSVTQTGGSGNSTRMVYTVEGSKRRLTKIIAPTAEGATCNEAATNSEIGCRSLLFVYEGANKWGAPSSLGLRLSRITYYVPGLDSSRQVANYSYDTEGRLIAAWDPRVSPALKETYTYESGRLKTLTPPGQEPWTFTYGTIAGETSGGRLISVKRPSLVAASPTAQITIAYGVPVSGSGAPYDMSPQAVAKWGQEDLPTDATAIFPADEVPASPPSSYAHAQIFYMDAEGQMSNVASPKGAGLTGPSITTTETDRFGNVVRELTPQNRLRALEAGAGSEAKSRELDTQLKYSADGTELQEERGPLHAVKLETGLEAGAIVQARSYISIQYDKGAPEPGAGETWPQLPTNETTGALVGGKVLDQQSVQHVYNWTLREETETIADPEGLAIKSVTRYNPTTALPVEVRQPKDATTPGAGSTKTTYYRAGSSPGACEQTIYAGLPCKIEPVAQPTGTPNLPITRFVSYTSLGRPTEVIEEVGSPAATRKTLYTYDTVGRQTSTEIVSGSGTAIPKVETLYDASKGLATTNRFVCPGSEPGCDTQTTTTSYDALGRVTTYQDADGNTATASYDLDGRVVTFNDGKGTQTYQYDAATGLLVSVVDSAAGTFTASYDADGAMVSRGLPNGLTAGSTVNSAGELMRLTYTKGSNCGVSCTWLDSEVIRSASGRVLSEAGTLGTKSYAYDVLGRLTKAAETPNGGGCTTRAYAYDPNSNRTTRTTRSPGVGGVCTESGGTTQSYSYDGADRLLGEGLVYDAFGRITNLPSSLAGGKALTTSYFTSDTVASQSQNGITNTYQLDAMLRHRQRLQGGGLEGSEVFHYASPGDSPSWTERGSAWNRNIVGIGGELAAVQESGKEITLSLTNLHGDVVASAAINPAVTSLKGTFAYDEFGNPTSGGAGRFGWLGGMQRRTELPSGIVQMGARSYVPAIGRFLSADPIAGGSANAYDYGNADPVNQFDPSGLKPYDNDCDPNIGGITGCQVWLHIKMWSPRGGRMGVRMIYKSNRAGGISRESFTITYWVDAHDDPYKEGFVKMPPPHYLNSYPGIPPDCRGTDPCANNHDGRGTFACRPGDEYQINIQFKYKYNTGAGSGESKVLEVQAQERCIY